MPVYNSRAWRAHFKARLPLPCSRCGGMVTAEMKWQIDHVVESDRGGPSDLSNLWPAHATCNQSAGVKYMRAKHRAMNAADDDMLGL